MSNKMEKIIIILAMLILPIGMNATDYYVAPTGSDLNNGLSAEQPFASLAKAQKEVMAGDIVYILPGTYLLSNEDIMAEETASSTVKYKVVFDLSKSGTEQSPIRYVGMTDAEGQRPVFDLSEIQVKGYRLTGFRVSGSYLVLKNFEIVGIKVDPGVAADAKTQSENIRVTNGSYNTFENLAMHDGWGIGIYINKSSAYNLVMNCDGYNNYDPYSDLNSSTRMGSGGNNDGFGCHVPQGNNGNYFIGCRAWNNADDGYDLISCASKVTFAYCIAYKNGYDAENVSRGDGNGFKAGGYGMNSGETASPVTEVSEGNVPMHEVHHSIAAANKSNGIYSNHHLGGVYFHDNTSYRNSRYNYSFVNRKGFDPKEAVDVNGYGHRIERNLSIVESGKDNHVTYLRGDEGGNTIKDNSFYWVNKNSGGWGYTDYGSSIFRSTRLSDLTLPREAGGRMAETTLDVMKQKQYLGLGCTFDDYEEALTNARKVSGAEMKTATSIHEVRNTDSQREEWYDLQGRRVMNPGKGLYIHNGRKIIIR